jgi:glycosyltransferase involved in cell wall biosynthesis
MAGIALTRKDSMEKIFAIALVKDEMDIIGYTISHLLNDGIDGVIVADNLSSDLTGAVLRSMEKKYGPDRVVLKYDNEPAFYQSRKMNLLAEMAVEDFGATWVMPFDADEMHYTAEPLSLGYQIRKFSQDNPDKRVIGAQLWNHFCTSKDEISLNPFKRMVWRHKERNPLDKVIVKYVPGETRLDEGNHRVFDKSGAPIPGEWASIMARHFQARSFDLWMHKTLKNAQALNMTNLPEQTGQHCRNYARIYDEHGEDGMRYWYYHYFYFLNPEELLIRDPAPYKGDL